MNLESQIAQHFRKTLRSLRLLDDKTVDEIIEQSTQSGLSPIEVLVRRGLVAPEELDVIDLLLRADEAIPGYELEGLIGRGGMGVVYRARQKNLNRIVALKTVLAAHGSDRVALARFEREATTIAQLAHPNIVCALDFGRHHGRLYLAMELVDGEDLSHFIERQSALSEAVAWGIARQVAGGLSHASKTGVIHRDIKPANILLVDPPEGYPLIPGLPMAKISDFGLAILNSQQVVSERLTSRDSALGSPHYMAPEQFGGDDCDTRADIYALGATVFHMLAGKPPWSGHSLQQIVRAKIQGQCPLVSEIRGDLSSSSNLLVKRMLEPDPHLRIGDYGQLMSDIDALLHAMSAPKAAPLLKRASARLTSPLNETPPTIPVNPTRANCDLTQASPTLALPGQLTLPQKHPARSAWNHKKSRVASVLGFILVVLVAGGIYMTGEGEPRIALEVTSEQLQLFNGQDLLGSPIVDQAGGWAARNGRIVHEEGTFGYLTFASPAWDYFSFEVNVECPPASVVFVQFAASGSTADSHRHCLKITGNRADLGTQDEVHGNFTASGASVNLDADRSAHAVKLRREVANWVVQVDRQESVSVRAESRQSSQITLAVQKASATEELLRADSAPASIAFSEIVATRLQPVGQ